MKKIVEYTIIEAHIDEGIDFFIDRVNCRLQEGWQLYGEFHEVNDCRVQVMVKYGKKECA